MTKFKEFYDEVPNKHVQPFRNRVIEEAKVSSATFNNWQNGDWEPKPDYWKAINDVCEEFGYPRLYSV